MKKTLFFILTILLISTSCKEDESNPVESGNGGTNPCGGITTVSYEGKTYNTVAIGNQCWLKENIDVGTMIPGSQYAKDDGLIEKYCYDDDPNNCNTYGGLYQWNEIMQYSTTPGVQGICPPGWHIPTLAEFQTLSTSVGGDGNALLAVGQGGGTNTSGFSALLAGRWGGLNYFNNLGNNVTFWSSTEYGPSTAYPLRLHYNFSVIQLDSHLKKYGFCVRCIKD